MHPALQIILFCCLYHVSSSENVDATDVPAKSCYSRLICGRTDFRNYPNEWPMQETSKIVFCMYSSASSVWGCLIFVNVWVRLADHNLSEMLMMKLVLYVSNLDTLLT